MENPAHPYLTESMFFPAIIITKRFTSPAGNRSSVALIRVGENCSVKIDLHIKQTPITLLKLEMPLKDIDVEIPQAQQVVASWLADSIS